MGGAGCREEIYEATESKLKEIHTIHSQIIQLQLKSISHHCVIGCWDCEENTNYTVWIITMM